MDRAVIGVNSLCRGTGIRIFGWSGWVNRLCLPPSRIIQPSAFRLAMIFRVLVSACVIAHPAMRIMMHQPIVYIKIKVHYNALFEA